MPGTKMLQRRGTTIEWASINPVLGDGEIGIDTTLDLFKIGDGVLAWTSLTETYKRWSVIQAYIDAADVILASATATVAANLATYSGTTAPAAYIAKSLIDAAGDLIYGTADNTPARLPKGTNGQHLTVSSGGVVGWETPGATDLSSTVALDGSRSMTGNQDITKADPKLTLSDNTAGSTTDRMVLHADTGVQQIEVDDALHICAVGSTISSPKDFKAGAIYDTGNRVYSLSNPPPSGGSVINQTIRGSSTGGGNVTIAAVVMAKTQLRLMTTQTGNSSDVSRVVLTTTTNVAVTVAGGGVRVDFELTEWT